MPPDTSASSLVWRVTFTEEVTRFGLANIEVSGTTAVPTISPSSGTGTSFTITLVPNSGDTNINLGVVQSDGDLGATDLAGNPIRVGIRREVRIERTTDAISSFIESSVTRYVNSSPSLTSRLTRVTPAPRTTTTAPSGSNVPDDDLSTNFSANVTGETMDASIGMTLGTHSFTASMNDYGQEFDYSGIFSFDRSRVLSWLPSWIIGEAYIPSGVEMWVQTSYSVSDTTGESDSSSIFLHTGVDFPITHDSILGVFTTGR